MPREGHHTRSHNLANKPKTILIRKKLQKTSLPKIAFLSEGGVGGTLSFGTKERVPPTKNKEQKKWKSQKSMVG